ncbi:hypothetical protein RQP46_009228 [Phenoliferia psychrophenolica]
MPLVAPPHAYTDHDPPGLLSLSLSQPWRTASLARNSLDSPSPLSLRTPTSSPGSPTDTDTETGTSPAPPALARRSGAAPAARAPSFDFGAFDAGEFEVLSLDDDDDDDFLGLSHSPVLGALDPEVDKSGHIEYKLKLPNPTPLRLAKLTTQLKWRIVEGGGTALYELGVLDDGTLVGLPRAEMQESLATLGKMLRGLGGGQVRVGRVVRLGSSPPSSDDPDDDPDPRTLFASFDVEPEEPDLDYDPGEPLPLLGTIPPSLPVPPPPPPPPVAVVAAANLSPTQPIAIPPRHPYPERTPAERAALKRNKRDLRRVRRESDGGAPTLLIPRLHQPRVHKTPVHNHLPHPPPGTHPKPLKMAPGPNNSKKLSQSAPAAGGGGGCRKPKMAEEGETRFVVEAIVVKEGPKEEEAGEGWRYLDFDWLREDKGAVVGGLGRSK